MHFLYFPFQLYSFLNADSVSLIVKGKHTQVIFTLLSFLASPRNHQSFLRIAASEHSTDPGQLHRGGIFQPHLLVFELPRELFLRDALIGLFHINLEHFWVSIAGEGNARYGSIMLPCAAWRKQLAEGALDLVLVGWLPEDEGILREFVGPGGEAVPAKPI